MKKLSNNKKMAGIWLVTKTPNSEAEQHIMHLGEIEELYPYAQMSVDIDELATYLFLTGISCMEETLVKKSDDSFAWSWGTSSDRAKQILKFLGMSDAQRKQSIEKLSKTQRAKDFIIEYKRRSNNRLDSHINDVTMYLELGLKRAGKKWTERWL
jgi:hypothetical protein